MHERLSPAKESLATCLDDLQRVRQKLQFDGESSFIRKQFDMYLAGLERKLAGGEDLTNDEIDSVYTIEAQVDKEQAAARSLSFPSQSA